MVLLKLKVLPQWLCSESSDRLASKDQLFFIMEAFSLQPQRKSCWGNGLIYSWWLLDRKIDAKMELDWENIEISYLVF